MKRCKLCGGSTYADFDTLCDHDFGEAPEPIVDGRFSHSRMEPLFRAHGPLPDGDWGGGRWGFAVEHPTRDGARDLWKERWLTGQAIGELFERLDEVGLLHGLRLAVEHRRDFVVVEGARIDAAEFYESEPEFIEALNDTIERAVLADGNRARVRIGVDHATGPDFTTMGGIAFHRGASPVDVSEPQRRMLLGFLAWCGGKGDRPAEVTGTARTADTDAIMRCRGAGLGLRFVAERHGGVWGFVTVERYAAGAGSFISDALRASRRAYGPGAGRPAGTLGRDAPPDDGLAGRRQRMLEALPEWMGHIAIGGREWLDGVDDVEESSRPETFVSEPRATVRGLGLVVGMLCVDPIHIWRPSAWRVEHVREEATDAE